MIRAKILAGRISRRVPGIHGRPHPLILLDSNSGPGAARYWRWGCRYVPVAWGDCLDTTSRSLTPTSIQTANRLPPVDILAIVIALAVAIGAGVSCCLSVCCDRKGRAAVRGRYFSGRKSSATASCSGTSGKD